MKFPLRYSLRTLFVLVTLIAIPLGWYDYHREWIRRRHEFLTGKVRYTAPVYDHSSRCPWQLKLFGEGAINLIRAPTDLQHEAARLFPEAGLLQWDLTEIQSTDFPCDERPPPEVPKDYVTAKGSRHKWLMVL